MPERIKSESWLDGGTERFLRKWERTRSRGRKVYILRQTLFLGLAMPATLTIVSYVSDGKPLSLPLVLVFLCIFMLIGFVRSSRFWKDNERLYEHLTKAAEGKRR